MTFIGRCHRLCPPTVSVLHRNTAQPFDSIESLL